MTHQVPPLISLIDRTVLVRAGAVALILGTVLTAINQAGAAFGQTSFALLPLALVYITPFVVVTLSQALGIRRAILEATGGGRTADRSFWSAAMSHGIPRRALLLGFGIGASNTVIVTVATLADGGSLADLPDALIAQAFVLPVVFGLVSQTLSFRRASAAIASS